MPLPKIELNPAATDLPAFHRFSHRAMATVFEIFIVCDDFHYAEQAAHAAFTELYFIEMELSRYVPGSDISRINTLPPNRILQIGHYAFECLNACKTLHTQTNGTFDVSVGAVLDCWRQAGKKGQVPDEAELAAAKQKTGLARLDLDEATHTVCLTGEHAILIDLGGYGKGYAVDRLAELLDEWSIEHALVHGGTSSVLGRGDLQPGHGWPVSSVCRRPDKPLPPLRCEIVPSMAPACKKASTLSIRVPASRQPRNARPGLPPARPASAMRYRPLL